jgi:hypothetical protein
MGSIALNSSIEPPLKESSFELSAASYPSPSAAPLPQSDDELQGTARSCIDSLNSMLNTKGYSQLISLMASTSYWRDHLCLSNTKFSTLFGAKEVISFIQKRGKQCNIKSFALGDKKPEIVNVDPIGKVKMHFGLYYFPEQDWERERDFAAHPRCREWRRMEDLHNVYNLEGLDRYPVSDGKQEAFSCGAGSCGKFELGRVS